MMPELVLAVTGVGFAGYVMARIGRAVAAQWFIVRAWRWLSGQAHHGKPVTDAGWFRPGRKALTRTGHATRFWHLPRWKRAAIRTGITAGVVMTAWGLLAAPAVTAAALAAAAAAVLAWMGWSAWLVARRRKERRTWLYPLHLAAHELAGHPRAALASSWITVKADGDGAIESARLALPQGWPADDKDKAKLVAITAAKLGIESPEASWRQAGPEPVLRLSRSKPPPRLVTLGDVRDDMGRCGPDEILLGAGKQESVVRASLSNDSPHIGVSMGSGAGKSNLAAFMLMQELHRGAVALVLDAKWISHPWLIGLPNVAYARTPAQLHAAMEWLGDELDRRNKVALRSVDIHGKVQANVGPRIFIVAEELNLATPSVKAYWAATREKEDPKRSPALTGLGSVAFAGRQVKMHLVMIGQMLTAEATGARDSSVRENIGIKALARYSPANWKVMAPEWPMPAKPTVLGRAQIVTASGVRETQIPLVDLAVAREFATAGSVTPCPAGMPGRQVTDTGRTELDPGADLLAKPVTVTSRRPSAVTLSEALSLGILHPETTRAALKMARHRGDFPEPAGQRGVAFEYDPDALTRWDAERRGVPA